MTTKRETTRVELPPVRVRRELTPAQARRLGTDTATAPARLVSGRFELVRIQRELDATRRLLYTAPAEPVDVAAIERHAAAWTRAAAAKERALTAGDVAAYARAAKRLAEFESQAPAPVEPDALALAQQHHTAACAQFAALRRAVTAGASERCAVLGFLCGRELERAYRELHRPAAEHGYSIEHASADARQEPGRRWPARVAELETAERKPGVTTQQAHSAALSAALAEYNAERSKPVTRRSFERSLSRWRKTSAGAM